ncbi:nucleoside recognition domain-containing protein [Bordetella avium]|uniref:nucleoside recognition domain-containing protein n=1 Tax=Bordetella avium TaxID=521 RepID=UPI0039FD15F9
MRDYAQHLLRRSLRLFFTLAKVMLPIMLLVQIGQWLGWVDALGRVFGPVMGLLNLPAQAALIWMASVFVGVYGALAVLASLAAGLEMTAAQFSALASMILFAHSLPVEQAIVRRAGASFWATAALRLGAAISYGGAVSWACNAMGWLSQPVSFEWLQGADMAGDPAHLSVGAWLQGTATSLALTFVVITVLLVLLVLLDIMDRSGLTRALRRGLTPVLRWSGLEPQVAPVTMLGVLLGLSYGGALIIEEAQRQQFSARTRFLALSWLSLSHSLIEDTLLLVAVGANGWIVLLGRVLLTLLVVAALARLWRPDARPA